MQWSLCGRGPELLEAETLSVFGGELVAMGLTKAVNDLAGHYNDPFTTIGAPFG